MNAVTGVILYLDVAGTGDYQMYTMFPEVPNSVGDGAIYLLKVLPEDRIEFLAGFKGIFPSIRDWCYNSLSIGVYHYFFGLNMDHLQYYDGTFVLSHQPYPAEWGVGNGTDTDYFLNTASTGLDPSLSRHVTYGPRINMSNPSEGGIHTYNEIDRTADRRYTSDGLINYDATVLMDRSENTPGIDDQNYTSDYTYKYPCSEHPKVTCELTMPYYDGLDVAYDDISYGYGRFFGTLQPYYREVNPLLPGCYMLSTDIASRAESSGSTTQQDNLFRIQYKQLKGLAPQEIKVWINNASERGNDSAGAGDPHIYTGYTMALDPTANYVQPFDYVNGVDFNGIPLFYVYKTKLSPGPHTYYFEANDGTQKVIWPRRPDRFNYTDSAGNGGYFEDWWVPTASADADRGTAAYDDNDFVPGPYINQPCVLSNATVTPISGKVGQNFTFSVMYQQPDGQRPYSAYVIISDSAGHSVKCQMLPVTPLNPTAGIDTAGDLGNSAAYKAGVYYYLDASTEQTEVLQTGTWNYRFEFTTDWGRQCDPTDTVAGELTSLPSPAGTTYSGPTVSVDHAPVLYNGTVSAQDGTSNSATLWNFNVTYRDQDNDPPALINVYTGRLQPDGKSILWDGGHPMAASKSNDVAYIGGVSYYYQTRLTGADANGGVPQQVLLQLRCL